MFVRLLGIVTLAAVFATAPPVSAKVSTSSCVSRYRKLLTRPVHSGAEFRYVGDIKLKKNAYNIVHYEWNEVKFPFHGMQFVLVFENCRRYLGSYLIDGEAISVRGRNLVLRPEPGDSSPTIVIPFDEAGPPPQALGGFERDW